MENTQNKNAVSYASFGAGKPVAPFIERQAINTTNAMDPSSCIRADRYPVPSSFDYASNPRNKAA